MQFYLVCVLLAVLNTSDARLPIKTPNNVFNTALYDEVLDPELCDQQVKYLRSDLFLNLRFVDAGLRLPRGLTTGNTVDLGNYHQCLGIDEMIDDLEIKGKYCMIRVPLTQSFELPGLPAASELDSELLERQINETHKTLQMINYLRGDFGERSSLPDSPLAPNAFRVAVCIPRACSVEQAMTSALFNLSAVGFRFEEDFCRLPNDKLWSPADYVAFVLFSLIGLLTVLSTYYDLNHTIIRKRDPKQASVLYKSFSLYTNGKRLVSFSSDSNKLQCLDGIRSISMLWVIVGHTFITENFHINFTDIREWLQSASALWILVAPFTVDTFIMITGLLLVYTTLGKMTGKSLLQNLHLFYLSRLLRLLPLLALTVLLQASLLNSAFDGPHWAVVASLTHWCREFWWTTMLHIQNYATPSNMCLPHSWYMAIDVQLHLVSPLVLFWILNGSRRVAWIVLSATLAVLYATTTYYNAYKGFIGNNIVLSGQAQDYMMNYYMNTFTRAAPFFIGMAFGYILNMWKSLKPKIHTAIVVLLWVCTFAICGVLAYAVHEVVQISWDNKIVDVAMNSYSRSVWSLALGWIIFACVNSYGGPVNWFLSLDMWRLPARVSYAMFLLHYQLQFTINSTESATTFFSVPAYTFKCLAYITLTFVLSFVACLVVDAPCSVLFKLMLGQGPKKEKSTVKRPEENGTKDKLEANETPAKLKQNEEIQ